jgi:sulfide:quinone oxidoreductase
MAEGRPRVVICGAGFGGIATAVALREQLPPDELDITLIDRRDDFVMGLRKTWVALGIDSFAGGRRRLADIRDVELQVGNITSIDPERRQVEVDGRPIAGAALVLALGAHHALDAVPGLADHGINVWDRANAERARSALQGMAGGRLLVGIFGAPYSCPPGPFELALLARERLGKDLEITLFSPAPIALPVVGPAESAKLERLLDEAGIRFLRGHQAAGVTSSSVQFADGGEEPFEVLLAVPPHRSPRVIVEAGMAEPAGWLMPDPRTLEMPQYGVYAIGDATAIRLANGMALPKAGIFAHAQGEVVAARIAARLRGEAPTATFDGEGACFIETGRGLAAKATGSFLADPPQVAISRPSEETMAEKREFERSRLQHWFGS